MPSFAATLIGAVLRATGVYKKRYRGGPAMLVEIEKARQSPPDLPTEKMKKQLAVVEAVIAGRSVWRIGPKGSEASAHILYFHGGGYVYPAVDVHWKFFAHLATKHGVAITAPLYPLAPEAGATETLDFAMEVYRAYAPDHGGPFVLAGDSAGGGLAAAVVQQARDEGLRLPEGIVLICPWLDIAVSQPEQRAIEPRDSILTVAGTQEAGRLYARDLPIDDPRVSPIHGNWDGLPPILMFGGGDDILVSDARRLKAKLPSVRYVEEAGLMHDWPIFFLRESRAAQAEIAEFARKAIHGSLA
ncbi:MAG: alpha/beta hydrolase [Sphingomonadales bacterium]|uniref:alpha/beta hydrolase n=3 Tax=Sphingorhabdus sp. TaxID=1902408 RepID=UPI003BB167E3|nr:alpha/beta hydrolase [Sphingomonadales bacterium]MBK9431147.1 alpha/beta hydrolase [Sphingomonadales bacterium]MBL0021284.1 alpha/beta hydrolase [Sphingomonadales bacterium]